MVKTHLKSNPPSRYRIGEKVHVRLSKKGKTSRKQQVIKALVEEKNKKKSHLCRRHLEGVNDGGSVLWTVGSDDYLELIEDQGHKLVYNPTGNGNCQFAALAYHLSSLGILRSPETMKEEIVKYLETPPLDGFPLYEWVPHFDSWPKYLTHIAQDHTYGDQLALYAAANLCNVNIHFISSLGAGASHVFHPGLNVPATR